jgi:cytidylate kinase
MNRNIAIDGPAGAGKSTAAKALAKELGYIYVDTGAIYRTVGLFARRQGVERSDDKGVAELLPQVNIELCYGEDGTQRMILCGEDVSGLIRTPEVAADASKVAAIPAVRTFLLEMQRELARTHDVVMDGRDIGTVVLPDAAVKIFLTASPETRAQRRYLELKEKGSTESFEQVLQEVIARDEQDMNRAVAPLKQAEDAVLADTSALNLEESVALLRSIVAEKLAEQAGE